MADRFFKGWATKHVTFSSTAHTFVSLIRSTFFWLTVEKIQSYTKPFVDLLCIVDTDKFVIMSKAIRVVKEVDRCTSHDHKKIAF